MITVNDKTIKLQIWDTVNTIILRQDSNHSNPSHEATIDQQLVPSLSTISLTASHSTTSRVGYSKPR